MATCEHPGCENAAVVGIGPNHGTWLCLTHFEQTMESIGRMIRTLGGEEE